jgi:Fur family ferric uptake transcriptional regulator
MTAISPVASPLVCDSLAEAVAALRDRGLRLSSSRRLVLEALFAAEGPVSAERIARRLSLDLSSVYRNLETFERHGLTRHVHLGHGPGLYVLLGHDEREYLYCELCGAVRALSPHELDAVRESVKEHFGYDVRFTHFAIVGTCPQCQRRPRRNALAPPATEGGQATMDEPHTHEHPHSHTHEHQEGMVHEHPHTRHDHDHVEHEHEHSHGDHVHSHPHTHEQGLENLHEHSH